jgi:uncharacterized membrane protein
MQSHNAQHENISRRKRSTYGSDADAVKKWGLLIGGSALAIYGVTRRSKSGLGLAAACGLLALRGAKKAAKVREPRAHISFAVNRTPAETYQFWRKFENLPLFMHHLESVKTISERSTEWTAVGPMDVRVRWTAEIVDDKPNELIAWRSLPDSDFQIGGFVEFRPGRGGRGTIILSSFEYQPSARTLGRAAAAIFGKDPEATAREDLRRFKALLEAGEIPTTDGQPHGRRSKMVEAIHRAYPDRQKRTERESAERILAQSRTAAAGRVS